MTRSDGNHRDAIIFDEVVDGDRNVRRRFDVSAATLENVGFPVGQKDDVIARAGWVGLLVDLVEEVCGILQYWPSFKPSG